MDHVDEAKAGESGDSTETTPIAEAGEMSAAPAEDEPTDDAESPETPEPDGPRDASGSDGSSVPEPEHEQEPGCDIDQSADDSAEAGIPVDSEPEADGCVESAGLPDVTPPSASGRPRVPWWPFEVYAIAWLALIAYAVFGLAHDDGSAPAVLQEAYPTVLLGAAILTAAGPALSLIAWLGAWLSNGRRGPGLLTASLIRGAIFTLVGVLAWWGTLTLVDAIRLGMVQ